MSTHNNQQHHFFAAVYPSVCDPVLHCIGVHDATILSMKDTRSENKLNQSTDTFDKDRDAGMHY